MAEVIRMPLLSDTMTEGKIVKWNKKVGDKVKEDDVLAEVETDKATMDVMGYANGTLLYVGVPEGKAAKVNDIIAIVGKAGEDYSSYLGSSLPTTPATSPAPAQSVTPEELGATVIRMPLLSDTMTEGKIVKWNKKVGDKVKSDDTLADVETDKATMEVMGYVDGTLLYIGVPEGKAAKVNDVIAIVGKEGTDIKALLNSLQAPPSVPTTGTTAAVADSIPVSSSPVITHTSDERIKASPLAKKLAQEKGIDLNAIKGSGDGGRIIKKDIDTFSPAIVPAAKVETPIMVPVFAPISAEEGYTDYPNSSMRKTIARRLGESMYNAPHFYLTMEIVMDNAIAARVQMNEVSPVKISFQDMLIKACALALKKHPAINSSWMGDFIRQWHHVHIGSAVAVDEGLIVPVIRFADQKSLSQIAAEAKILYTKAKDKKLQPNEFSGNTFTISNLGMMNIDEFTAIINPPDSCILAVGRIKEEVVKKEDGFGVRNIMKITLSCDHRSVDGAMGATFLQTLKKLMENPVTMLV
ncbi:MAG TPA: 2-oxo acid dehydrogenase subunit E2 [Chitinophagaceae bacterium]|nr:2-oxo acid dehydrogenase subunit E2 [Chitinophagaceae bacterium]